MLRNPNDLTEPGYSVDYVLASGQRILDRNRYGDSDSERRRAWGYAHGLAGRPDVVQCEVWRTGKDVKLIGRFDRREPKSDLHQQLQAALGLSDFYFDYYASDLYVADIYRIQPDGSTVGIVRQWLSENYPYSEDVTGFTSVIDGEAWLDIPFAGRIGSTSAS